MKEKIEAWCQRAVEGLRPIVEKEIQRGADKTVGQITDKALLAVGTGLFLWFVFDPRISRSAKTVSAITTTTDVGVLPLSVVYNEIHNTYNIYTTEDLK